MLGKVSRSGKLSLPRSTRQMLRLTSASRVPTGGYCDPGFTGEVSRGESFRFSSCLGCARESQRGGLDGQALCRRGWADDGRALCVLALFVDLLISQGRVPSYAELSSQNRQSFVAGLNQFSGERRHAALQRSASSAEDGDKLMTTPLFEMPAIGREQLWRAVCLRSFAGPREPVGGDDLRQLAKAIDPTAAPGVPGLGIAESRCPHGLVGSRIRWWRG